MTLSSGAPDPVPMRIGDAERNSALDALGEHLSAGRLDIDEYGERSAKVTVARTTADLAALFTDLPAPHPTLSSHSSPAARPAASTTPATADARIMPVSDVRTPAQRWSAVAVPLAAVLAVGLFFWLHTWIVFLLPAVVAVLSGGSGGSNDRKRRR
jgi:hypothetical protein